MTRRRECATTCCSTPTCEIGSDEFSVDGSGAPSGWTQREGTVDGVSGGIVEITTSDTIMLFNTAHPDGIAAQFVSIDVYFGDGTDEAIIIMNHDGSDDDNFYFVKMTEGFLSLWQMSGGTPTLLNCVAANNAGVPSTITAYFDGQTTGIFAADSSGVRVWVDVGTGHSGTYVGLGSRTIGTVVAFDAFDYRKYSQGADSCPSFSLDDCDLGEDDFDRPNSSDIGCPWEDLAGASEIDSNRLKFTSANSRVRFRTGNPDNGAMRVTADVASSNTGNIVEIGLGYSGGTYWWARLQFGTGGTFALGSTASGTLASTTVTTATATTYGFVAALSDGLLCAEIQSGGTTLKVISIPVTVPSGERFATLGCTTLTGNITCDNFVLKRAHEDSQETCLRCGAYAFECADCCPVDHGLDMIVDIGSGLTNKATCSLCSQVDGEFTATLINACTWIYCQHDMSSLPDPCVCADYDCDSDCNDGGFPESGPGTQECHSGDGSASAIGCNGIYIIVETRVDTSGKCYLWVWVMLLVKPAPTDDSPCIVGKGVIMAEACYATALGDDVTPCSGDTYTLDLYNGSFACNDEHRPGHFFPPYSDGCNGAWPATITVRAA